MLLLVLQKKRSDAGFELIKGEAVYLDFAAATALRRTGIHKSWMLVMKLIIN
jgi:hypothetical protein